MVFTIHLNIALKALSAKKELPNDGFFKDSRIDLFPSIRNLIDPADGDSGDFQDASPRLIHALTGPKLLRWMGQGPSVFRASW